MKKCKNCGKEITNKRNKNFCDSKCRSNYLKSYNVCIACGEKFKVKQNKDQKYCSMKCYSANRIKESLKLTSCECCGKEFQTSSNRPHRFCSHECRMKDRNNKGTKLYTCKRCGKEFKNTLSSNSKYCSYNCKYEAERKYDRGLMICKTCGKKFYDYTHRKYCSASCKPMNRSKTCNYKGTIVKSTYELRTCNILDEMLNRKEIAEWNYESKKVKYNYENKDHYYIIDYEIILNNGAKKYIEVKGWMKDVDLIKIETAKDQLDIEVWRLEEINNKEIKYSISKDDIKYLLKSCIL